MEDKQFEEFIEELKKNISDARILARDAYDKPYRIYEMCIEIIDKLVAELPTV